MLRRALAGASLGLALLAGGTTAQKPALDLEGSVWTAPQATVRTTSRVRGLPQQGAASDDEASLQLRLAADGWLLLADGEPLAGGDWVHAAPTRRAVQLALDEDGQRLLEEHLTAAVRQRAEAAGLEEIVVTTGLHRSRWRLRLRPEGGGTWVAARLAGTVRARGELTAVVGGLPLTRRWSARLKVRARSEPVLLQQLLLEPDPGPPEPPVADFALGASVGEAPFTVHFASTSGGTVDEHLWDFGDGATSVALHPVHLYAEPGLYRVTLTVTGPLGEDSHERSVLVEPGSAPPLPRTTLYPALVGFNNSLPRLLETLGWESYFWVGMTGGFTWKFTRDVETGSNGGRAYQLLLGVDAARPQKVRATVYLRRAGTADDETLFGPHTFAVKGSQAEVPPIETFFASTLEGPVMDAAPGDRLFLELENVSTKFKKNGNLRIHLGLCQLLIPETH